jgi:DNA-binding phage protein
LISSKSYVMPTIETELFDPAEYLVDEATIRLYLNEVAKEGSQLLMAVANADVARARELNAKREARSLK